MATTQTSANDQQNITVKMLSLLNKTIFLFHLCYDAPAKYVASVFAPRPGKYGKREGSPSLHRMPRDRQRQRFIILNVGSRNKKVLNTIMFTNNIPRTC